MLPSIPGSRGEGSGPPWPASDNEAKITQSPPNRLGCTLIDKTSNTVLLINASYVRGTDTARVEGLWLGKRP